MFYYAMKICYENKRSHEIQYQIAIQQLKYLYVQKISNFDYKAEI